MYRLKYRLLEARKFLLSMSNLSRQQKGHYFTKSNSLQSKALHDKSENLGSVKGGLPNLTKSLIFNNQRNFSDNVPNEDIYQIIFDCFPKGIKELYKRLPSSFCEQRKALFLEPTMMRDLFKKDELAAWRNNLQRLRNYENDFAITQAIGALTLMSGEIRHLSLIIDGNRRWALSKGLPTIKGHEKGHEEVLPRTIYDVFNYGVHTFSIWALSNYNMLRNKEEILQSGLPTTEVLLKKSLAIARNFEARIFRMGSDVCLSDDQEIRDALMKVLNQYRSLEDQTRNFNKHHLIFFANYVGEDDLLRAVQKIYVKKLDPRKMMPRDFLSHTDMGNQPYPSPDLLIRTASLQKGGRIGNFIPNLAETRLYFTQKPFPEFNIEDIFEAAASYAHPQNKYKSSNYEYGNVIGESSSRQKR